MTRTFDLVAIGTGSGASTVASRCRSAGWQVAIVDSRPFGGTCALRGCDPKKVLVGAAEALDWNRRMQGKGVRADQSRIEWSELMRFKRSFTEPVPKYREDGFSKAGIAIFHGRARFVGPAAVQVGEDILEGRKVVVATGAKPVDLNVPGTEHVTTSDQFLELDQLPGRIVFIGGGYISFEFANVAARAGAQATILHRGPRPLERFDPDLVDRLVARTRQIGVDVQLQTEVKEVAKRSAGLTVRASTLGQDREFEADLVIHGAGRVPEIDDMDLAKANVQWDPQRGVKVNEYLQSVSNPAVYAAGDAAASGGAPLTPVAGYEGQIVAANLLEGNQRKPNYEGVASVVFTIPPLASVGLHEQEARERGLRFRTNHQDTSLWYSSRRVGEGCSAYKVLVEESSGDILGAHLLGPGAEETINLFALAIRQGVTAADLKGMLFAYPTHASDVQYML
ncbi:MAG: NAD(P)/FAD-dependent oxidoreductase [Acidobacteria bacterium]|nr:NAD(P)/FAD-dependent oxidoreductase [Acidobacteriota bacterium]